MTNKLNYVQPLTNEDLKAWAEWVATDVVTDLKHEKQLKRLSKRQANLGDITTLVNFLGQKNDGYMSLVIERLSILELAIKNKTGLTDEEISEAEKEYKDNLAKFQEEANKLVAEAKAEADNANG